MAGFYRKGENAGWIWGVFVSPNHRGAGVGRAVMDGLMDTVKQVPRLREVHLEVAPSQGMARRLYQSCGFRTYADEEPSSEREHMVYLLEE
jgi:ribosomal protein S18 acetylase RimI-like enzyme